MASGSHSIYSSSDMIRDDLNKADKVCQVCCMHGSIVKHTRFHLENLQRQDLLGGPRQR
jgi:hypothetical protein